MIKTKSIFNISWHHWLWILPLVFFQVTGLVLFSCIGLFNFVGVWNSIVLVLIIFSSLYLTFCLWQLLLNNQIKTIVEWFKSQHKLEIGERSAEKIKCESGSATRIDGENISVKGRDLITGIPKTIDVPSDEIRQALAETVYQITTAIKKALDKTPPEHASDIIEFGIILTGGGSLLKNLDVHIRNKTGLPVNVAEDPLFSVVKGTGMVLENIKKFQEVLIAP